MNILIAEDTPLFQAAHAFSMKRWGFAYDMAGNGVEAVNYARANIARYDLCIMDVEIPIMDGIEAVRMFRRCAKYLPVLGYSSDPEQRENCLRAGMDAFEEKPCPPERLLAIIRELTTKRLSARIETDTVFHWGIADECRGTEGTPRNKKQGLTKLKVVRLPGSFVVHKNIQNKISHDLIAEGKEISEFIDRSPNEPARCHLYRANPLITRDLLLPEELAEAARLEDDAAAKYSDMATECERSEQQDSSARARSAVRLRSIRVKRHRLQGVCVQSCCGDGCCRLLFTDCWNRGLDSICENVHLLVWSGKVHLFVEKARSSKLNRPVTHTTYHGPSA